MQNPLVAVVALFAFAGVEGLKAQIIDAESTITQVTVYTDRARVERDAKVTLPAGRSSVRFSGLPVQLDPSTVQATAEGTRRFKILGTEIRDHFETKAVSDEVRRLQNELQGQEDALARVKAEKEDQERQREFLEAVKKGISLGSEGREGSGPTQLKELLTWYAEGLAMVRVKLEELEKTGRDIVPEIERLKREIQRLQAGARRQAKEVIVAVECEQPVEAEFRVSYNVSGASWSPLYDARVETETGKVVLSYTGVVRQSTGEEWKNVKMILSTARPGAGAVMPELDPWWLTIAQPIQPLTAPAARTRGSVADASAGSSRFSNWSADAVGQPQPMLMKEAVTDNATISQTGISTVFEAPLPVTIPSDGEGHNVPLAQQDFQGKMVYVATPKLSLDVYLRTNLKNTSGAPLLAGPVNLFRDGDYIGQGHLQFTAADEEFEFYLGVDDSIRVERKLLADRSGEGGLIKRRKVQTRRYETTFQNLKSSAVDLLVYDQIPVSQNESIQVTGVKFSQPPAEQNKETGELEWKLELPAGEKQVLTMEFTVEWPADKEITGL